MRPVCKGAGLGLSQVLGTWQGHPLARVRFTPVNSQGCSLAAIVAHFQTHDSKE